MGSSRLGAEEQNEWYFFSHKDKKYPTGTRTNRATAAGFWKATGRDKAIYSKHELIGMRKTLVFYKGRAPNGQKSDWIMHEYRLETDENGTPQEEGWVVCRVFKKRTTTMRKVSEHDSPCWYEDQVSFMQDSDSPKRRYVIPYNPCKKDLELPYHHVPHEHFLQVPLLESPKFNLQSGGSTITSNPMAAAYATSTLQNSSLLPGDQVQVQQQNGQQNFALYGNNGIHEEAVDQVTDWRVLDKFVATQLSQEDGSKDNSYSNNAGSIYHTIMDNVNEQFRDMDKQEMVPENNASTSTSSCPIDLWK